MPAIVIPAPNTNVKKSDIINNLTSTSTTAPLSANMGKTLNEKTESYEWTSTSQASTVLALALYLRNTKGLPASFVKAGTFTVSDGPFGNANTAEFEGLVFGKGDRLTVIVFPYTATSNALVFRTIYQSAWRMDHWATNTDVGYSRSIAANGTLNITPGETGSMIGLLTIHAYKDGVEHVEIYPYVGVNKYACNLGNSLYTYKYNNITAFSAAINTNDGGVTITNLLSSSVTVMIHMSGNKRW